MAGNFLNLLFGLGGKPADLPAPTSPIEAAPPDRSSDAWRTERYADRLSKAMEDLRNAEPAIASLPLIVAERRLQDLASESSAHPMLAPAAATIKAFKVRVAEATALPPLRQLGQVEDRCPSCWAMLRTRPRRKSKCPSCQAQIYVRTRPLDGVQVLLGEAELPALEEDWRIDYETKQRKPRDVDPVWAARIEAARSAGPDPDPIVEAAAQRVFAALLAEGVAEAPRDVLDRLLAEFQDHGLRARVEVRVWQLQFKGM